MNHNASVTRYFLISSLSMFFVGCKPSSNEIKLTFQVDVPTNIEVHKVGIIGRAPLLSWQTSIEMVKEGAGYKAVLIIPDSVVGKRVNYKFAINDTIVENEGYRGRQILYPATSTVLPIAKFDDMIGSTGPYISKSDPLPVVHANTPEEELYFSKPFVGVTTEGKPKQGLFPIKLTGASTIPVKNAVELFLASLTTEQQSKTLFDIEDEEWRKWHNIEIYERQGIGLEEMNKTQKSLAFKILDASLSERGVEKTKSIMTMEDYLSEMSRKYVSEEEADAFGHDKYYFTVMGKPSTTEPWGWQIDGHHIVVNYFILGDQVVMTPTFLGSEPTFIAEGPNKGLRTFEAEDRKGLIFYLSLTEAQKEEATLLDKKAYNFVQAEAFKDNQIIPYVGLKVDQLSANQNELFLEMVEEYIGNMDHGHAAIKMQEITDHMDGTYFSWVGKSGKEDPFYYRVHSPVVLIEFDNQGPVFLWDRNGLFPGPIKGHTHTIVRTPNGNDYGKDLLKQHLESHHHEH